MSINIETELLLSLTEATKTLPRVNGKRPAISTIWRWCRKGIRGVRLEYVRVGRSIATSREALNRFFVALAASDPVPSASTSPSSSALEATTSRERQRLLDDADHVLSKAGI